MRQFIRRGIKQPIPGRVSVSAFLFFVFFFFVFFFFVFLSTLLISFSFVSPLMAQDGSPATQDPTATGVSIGSQAVSMFGTKEGINTRMFIPLMSDTPMTTYDGSTSFNARLVCSGTAKIMEIFVQPSASGDLTNVIITQDTDLNGSMDYTYAVPFAISGVCSNGVISCSPGTWTNCQGYRWVSDGAGRVSLAVTSFTNLGGCYCINSSCGSDLVWRNLPIVLHSLGGGAVGGIQSANARMAISDVQIDGTLARYYGQSTRNCSTIASDSNVEQFYYLPGNIESGINATVAAQSSDPSSLYSLMSSAYQNTPQSDIKTCSIIRSAVTRWNSSWECYADESINNQCTSLENDPECQLREEVVDNVIIFRNFASTGLTPQPSCITLTDTLSASCEYSCPANPVLPCAGDPPQCSDGSATYNCQIINPVASYGGGWGMAVDATSGLKLVGTGNKLLFQSYLPTSNSACPLGDYPCQDYGYGYTECTDGFNTELCTSEYTFQTTGYIEYLPGIEVWGEVALNTFRQFAVSPVSGGIDPQGRQYDSAMYVFGTYAYELGLYTGYIYFKGINITTQGNQCWGYGGAVAVTPMGAWNMTGCYVDYHGHSTGEGSVRYSPYICPIPGASSCIGNPGYCNKTCEKEVCHDWWRKQRTYLCRAQGVDFSDIQKRARTIRESASRTDSSLYYRDYIEGEYQEKTLSFSGGTETTESCEKACKTRKIIRNTETTIVATRSDYVANPEGYEFYYKSCLNDTCPLDDGESIVKNCQCINDFAEASVIMQTLRMGGQDFICSSGTPRPLQ